MKSVVESIRKSILDMIDFDILKRRKEVFARGTGVKLEAFYKIVDEAFSII